VIAICYVDDLVFWARNLKDIVELSVQLQAEGVYLEQEDNAAGFLGFTPAEGKPLAQHVHGEPASGNLNHSNVVGMFLYLAGHKHPDITYSVNCAARYMFCPKLVYKQALKQIGHYLKATAD
ncbi:hypothetical protein ACHAXS_000188, partial [Conticribra weissflogii]